MEDQTPVKLPASLAPIKIPGYLRMGQIAGYLVRLWTIIGIFALAMRIFLLLAAANPATPFVRFIYDVSADYMRPFTGIFPAKPVGGDSYFDVSAAFAILVYFFLMWVVSEFISYVDTQARLYKERKRTELLALEQQEQQRQRELAQQQAQQQAQPANKPVTIASTVATDTVIRTQEIKQTKPRR